MISLMEGLQSKKGRRSFRGGGATFTQPRQSWGVVGKGYYRPMMAVGNQRDEHMLTDDPGEFKIGVVQMAMQIVVTDEVITDVRREGGSPYVATWSIQKEAAHTVAGGVSTVAPRITSGVGMISCKWVGQEMRSEPRY